MPQKPSDRLKSKLLWPFPSFGLRTLFGLVAIVGVYLTIRQSHFEANAKLRMADKQVQSAMGATKEILFDQAATLYRRNHADQYGNVPDRKNLYAFMKQSVTEQNSGSSFKDGGIWKGESKSERSIVLYGIYPGASNDFSNPISQLELDAYVGCRSPWYIFAGKVRCEVELREAPLNQEFIDILTQRLVELDIPVSVIE